MSQARGLTVFISDLRNCTNPEQERKRVEKEMAHIRSKFTTEGNMNGERRRACLRPLARAVAPSAACAGR